MLSPMKTKAILVAAAVASVLMAALAGSELFNSTLQTRSAVAQPSSMSQMSMTTDGGQQLSGAVDSQNKPLSKVSDGIKLSFSAQPIIHAYDLASVQLQVMDANSSARLSHVDWAISVKDPDGKVIYKTTTGHSHVGVMNFKVAFPTAGNNSVSLTVSSIGSMMMGLEVEPQGRTHTMLSGSPMGFKTDPVNDFGARTFDFPVYVQPYKQVHTIAGTVPGTGLNVELASTASAIVTDKPTPFVITVTRANDSAMITHPDLQVTVTESNSGYVLSQSAPVEDMMTMHGAIHGHTGVMTLMPSFPIPGNYVIDVNLQPSPLSNYTWGQAHTQFNIIAAQSATGTANASSAANPQQSNTVSIVGLESPFFVPNTLNIKAGTTVTFVNTDGNTHTVTSVKAGTTEPDGTFDSGVLRAGKTFSYTFNSPGTYEYICMIHTHMRGVIQVS